MDDEAGTTISQQSPRSSSFGLGKAAARLRQRVERVLDPKQPNRRLVSLLISTHRVFFNAKRAAFVT